MLDNTKNSGTTCGLGSRRTWYALPVVLASALLSASAFFSTPNITSDDHSVYEIADGISISPLKQKWLDCSSGIYLDVGTNVAVQIRKLYEPDKFPGAKVLPVFDKYFGRDRSRVCAVGFEPNTAHTEYLKKVNAHFEERSLPAHIFTEVAVSARRGSTTFFTDPAAPKDKHEWGASLAPWNAAGKGAPITVQLVDLQNFVLDFVVPHVRAGRRKTGKKPPIVMKMDIEGAEYVVIPAMMVSGALCHIDLIFAEWHEGGMRLAMQQRSNLTSQEMLSAFEGLRVANHDCKVEFSHLDDESYVDGTAIPL
jgi:hypothetical protein